MASNRAKDAMITRKGCSVLPGQDHFLPVTAMRGSLRVSSHITKNVLADKFMIGLEVFTGFCLFSI